MRSGGVGRQEGEDDLRSEFWKKAWLARVLAPSGSTRAGRLRGFMGETSRRGRVVEVSELALGGRWRSTGKMRWKEKLIASAIACFWGERKAEEGLMRRWLCVCDGGTCTQSIRSRSWVSAC